MNKRKYYVAPEMEAVSLSEDLMTQGPLTTSTSHGAGVRDKYEDENIDADGSFGFAKVNNNWSWEED